MTGTIGVPPALSSLSCSIFSLGAYGTGLALWKIEVAVRSTWILTVALVEFQAPPRTAEHIFAKSLPVGYCEMKVV